MTVALLQPVGRRVQLTPQAEILVAHTEVILHRLEQAEAELAVSLTEVTGTVHMACFQTAALALIPPALSRLGALHPALRVEVTELEPGDSLPALMARRFDLVVGDEYRGHLRARTPDVEQQNFVLDRIRLGVPGDDQVALSLADVRERPWVMEPEGTLARQWTTELCRAAGFEPDVRFTSSDLLLHARLVRSGHAVALLPDLLWRASTPIASLHSLSDDPARHIFSAVRRGAEHTPAISALRAALAAAATSAPIQT